MKIQSRYLKFQIPHQQIFDILKNNFKRVIFHIDLPSISRGFYNRQIIELELSEYLDTQKMPNYFLLESKQFFGELFNRYKQFSPRFNIFYDNGNCGQNNAIYSGYKDRSRDRSRVILEDLDMELFHTIKDYYYQKFEELFNIPNFSNVTFLKDYEADFIPWIMLKYNIWDCANPNTLNIILSLDKDLLQCCQFKNVVQVFTLYINSKIKFNVYNDDTAVNQLYEKALRGQLTAKYIPTILSLAGDKADKIPGIPKVGEASAYRLIINHNLPACLTDSFQFPNELEEYKKLIIRNYKLISFDEQLKRIPYTKLTTIQEGLSK